MGRWIAVLILLCPWPSNGQQAIVTVAGEPGNLDAVKQHLKNYHDCGEANCYTPQLERQADIAIQFLNSSVANAKQGEKLALVLDVDETSLSNWQVETHDDFGYIPNDSNWCEALKCGKAISSTLRIFLLANGCGVKKFIATVN
jgi:hypothetical protein